MLLGVVGGCGKGNNHQVRFLKKLLIGPKPNTACGDDAGRDGKEGSGENE